MLLDKIVWNWKGCVDTLPPMALMWLMMKVSFCKQLLVQAYDDGYPALSDTEVVSITVNRNLQPPVFTTNSIEITILESQALGVAITTATANDPDALVSSHQ